MILIRRFFLAAVLMAGLSPAIAQVPAPVPALPDTERRTSYIISGTTCACAVNFALYGDSTDYQNWVEVFINGVRYDFNDATHGWTITSPSGSLSTLARPITNAVLTFNQVQTGTVQIVGARRPRRTSQFNENAGVSARNLNQVITDIISQNREIWDKTNDVTGRALLGLPGETIGLLPSATARAGALLAFDGSGNPVATTPGAGTGNVIGPASSVNNDFACWNGTTGKLLKDCSASLSLTVGSSSITSGITNGLLYNNAGVLGNLATANSGALTTDGSGNPSITPNITISGGLALNATNSGAGTISANANQDASSLWFLQNTSAGTSALAALSFINNNGAMQVGVGGANYAASGGVFANRGFIVSAQNLSGIWIGAGATAGVNNPIIFGMNTATESGRFLETQVGALRLGVAGSSVGTLVLTNATSGTQSIKPATGALGTGVATLVAGTYSLVGDTLAQALTNKTIDNTNTVTLKDTLFTLQDDGDATKQARWQLSGITTGQTRTYTLPDTSDTVATLAATQALTNKTYNGNTLTAGTFTLTGAASKALTFNNSITLSGTDATTMTFPTTTATIARTDAAQSFTGVQTYNTGIAVSGSNDTTNNQNGASTVSLTNNSGGTGAIATFNLSNGTNSFNFTMNGVNKTASGFLLSNTAYAGATSDFNFYSLAGKIGFSTGGALAEQMRLSASGGLVVGNAIVATDPGAGSIAGAGAIQAAPPATKTTNYTQLITDHSLILNGSGTITLSLLSAATYPGRQLIIKTIAAQTVVSNTSNVVPQTGGAASTAILAATAGKWAILISDGTNWQIMASN